MYLFRQCNLSTEISLQQISFVELDISTNVPITVDLCAQTGVNGTGVVPKKVAPFTKDRKLFVIFIALLCFMGLAGCIFMCCIGRMIRSAPLSHLSEVSFINKKQCSRQLQCEVPCRPVMSSILPCPPCLLQGGGGLVGGGGSSRGWGEGPEGGWGGGRCGRGHFIHPAISCTTTCMVLRPEGTSHNKQVRLHVFEKSGMSLVERDLGADPQPAPEQHHS